MEVGELLDPASERHGAVAAFLRQVVGLRIFHEYGDGSAVVGVLYFLGGGFLELSGATPGRANGFSTLWLQVPDVSREETRLRGLGVPLGAPAF
jgi:hypothetical protein